MSPWISDLYLRSQTDARLLSLTRDGHGRAFAVLAERYRAELLGQARRLSSSANAEDLLQQTMLSAFAALNRGAEVGHVRGWLHAILRNAATRARGPVDAPLELAMHAGEAPDALLEARADARLVLSALDELPARQREALVGSTVQGLSRAELATTLGVSEGAVRQLVHRARSAVRAAITSVTPYPVVRWLTGAGGSASAGPPELALVTGAAGAGGVVAKLGMVAAAGAIAASGLAAAGHHATRGGAHAGHRVHLVAGGEFVTAPAHTTVRAGASALRASSPGPGRLGAGDFGGRPQSTPSGGRGGRGGSRAGDGGSVSGHDGGARSGSDGATSRPSSGDAGSRGSDTSGRGPSAGSNSGAAPGSETPGSSPTGSGGPSGSGEGKSGTGSGDTTTTAAPGVPAPAATTASDGGGVSDQGGSNIGGGSGTVTPGSGAGSDGSQTAQTSTTSTGSRDLLPPAGSSVPTDH